MSLVTGSVFAADYNYTDQWKEKESSDGLLAVQIPLRVYDVTNNELIGAAVEVTIWNNWKIEAYSKDTLVASYKRSRIEISIDEKYLTIKEVPLYTQPKEKWLQSLRKHIENRIKYHHYMRKIAKES
jgi:hypothetical protein